jgi:hypothetical protein
MVKREQGNCETIAEAEKKKDPNILQGWGFFL